MKLLEELEEKFLNEIKPLVDQFVQMGKQQLDIEQRMECADIRKQIQARTGEFVKTYRDMSSKEIERIQAENVQINIERSDKIRNMVQIRQDIVSRDIAIKEAKGEGKNDTYQLLCITQRDEIKKFKQMKQQCEEAQKLYKFNIGQIEQIEKAQPDFEEKYGDMDYITEKEMYRLDVLIGKNEECKTVRISNSQAYDENGNVLNMDNILQKTDEELKQERKEKLEQLREQVEKVFDEAQTDFNEVEAKVDEELREEARQKELSIQEDEKEQDVPKKGIIRRLWEKAKSFFERKVIPALIEPIEQEPGDANTFKKEVKKDAPTLSEQAENSKEFANREKNPETEQKISDVLTILD